MLRLRTTSALSVLALTVGVAGTAWLCTLTAGWAGPSVRTASLHTTTPHHPHRAHRWHGPVSVVQARRSPTVSPVQSDGGARAAAVRDPLALVPVATPDDASQPYYQLRGHLDGRVLVHLHVDSSGRVTEARVARSSGDAVLDQHALRSVRAWRFAVPANQPGGISGDLPMRFATVGRG